MPGCASTASVTFSVLGFVVVGEAELLEPAHEAVGEGNDGEPGPVGVDVGEREPVSDLHDRGASPLIAVLGEGRLPATRRCAVGYEIAGAFTQGDSIAVAIRVRANPPLGARYRFIVATAKIG